MKILIRNRLLIKNYLKNMLIMLNDLRLSLKTSMQIILNFTESKEFEE